MQETNFLIDEQEKEKKPKKKRSKKPAKGRAAAKRTAGSSNARPDNSLIEKAISQAAPETGIKSDPVYAAGRSKSARKIYRQIAISFVILTLALISAVFYFSFSRVTILIIPATEKVTDSFSLTVKDGTDETAAGEAEIIGAVKQVPVEQSQIFAASGKEILGEEVSGKVTLINNYLKNQPLVATTRILSQDNKLFRLKKTVNVPAGGRVEAEVYADEASQEMAIGPSKFTIPGLWAGLQDKIYAESQAPMIYSEKVRHLILQSDIDQAVSDLKKVLLAKAKKEVAQAYQEYNQSILEVDNNSITTEISDKVGDEKENFSVKIKTMVTLVAFKDDDVYEQAAKKIASSLADDKRVLEFSRPETTYSLGGQDLNQGTALINVNFTAKVALEDSAGMIQKNNLSGMDTIELKKYLDGRPDIASYEIKFFPGFLQKMPTLSDRIKIEIVNPQTAN